MPYIIDNKPMGCRFCGTVLDNSMVDLGVSPLCEVFLKEEDLHKMEPFYPLEALVCHKCFLVQTAEYSSNEEIFSDDYGYYSSFSTSWLEHAKRYVDMMVDRNSLDSESFVVEIASNDGYLLRNFVDKNIPCLGIDPAANVAEAAKTVNVETRVAFFTDKLAADLSRERGQADLIIGNNVLAHTPYINDFVSAVKTLLAPQGTATFEFPHLIELIKHTQFDTIYHEHFSYYSLTTVREIFQSVGLCVVDVQQIQSAGGSLRIFLEHEESAGPCSDAVVAICREDLDEGLFDLATYAKFSESVAAVKNSLLQMLIELKNEGKSVVGYGAPGKGNTLLNYCGIKTDLLAYTVDMNHHKHGRYLPGSRIPVYSVDMLAKTKPDYIVILPWNLTREITAQIQYAREWGAQFITPIPTATILE